MNMNHDFKVRDVISEIGIPKLFVVVGVENGSSYYSLQEIDKDGNDLCSFYGMNKVKVKEKFVKVGTWRKKELPSGFQHFDMELQLPVDLSPLDNQETNML